MIISKYKLERPKTKISLDLVHNQHILLMPIGDIHYGSRGFPKEMLRDYIQWGLDRGAYFIGLGEYLDFTSASQRKILDTLREDAVMKIGDIVRQMADDFFGLIDISRGRWLGLLEGDHRWEFEKGISVDQYLCGLLNCDFLGTSALIRLSFDSISRNHPEADTIIYCHHGIGSSRSAGGHLNRVEDLLKWIDADIYLMGHSHGKVSAPIDRQYVSPDGKHFHRTKYLARTGAWLRGYMSSEPLDLSEPAIYSRGTYVEQKAYTPTSMGGLCFGIGYEQIKDSQYYRPTIQAKI